MAEVAAPAPFPLARSSFDRVAHRRDDAQWLADAWQRAEIVVVTPQSATPVPGPDSPALALRKAGDVVDDVPRRFLGVVGDVPYFTVTVERDDSAGPWLTLRELGATMDELQASLLASSIALEQWHQRHTHCPLCGAATVETSAGWTRTCPVDESQHFPRTDPAVIMLVHDGKDHALLAQGVNWGAGRYSTLAGFVEPGESLESAVAREVFEEVGVHVADVRYVASQPWPFPSSLMLGFGARLEGGRDITIDPSEVTAAAWFSRDEVRQAADWTDLGTAAEADTRLRAIPPRLSISRYLIDRWLEHSLPG